MTAAARPDLEEYPLHTSAFDLPDHLAAKADPALVAADERHFAAIAESLEQTIAELNHRAIRLNLGQFFDDAFSHRREVAKADR